MGSSIFPSHLELRRDPSGAKEVFRLVSIRGQAAMTEQASPTMVRDNAETGRDRETIDPRADVLTWVRDNWVDGMGLEVFDGDPQNARSFFRNLGKPGDANEESYGGIYTGVPGKLLLGPQIASSLDLGGGSGAGLVNLPSITTVSKNPLVIWGNSATNTTKIHYRDGTIPDGWTNISIGSNTHKGHITSDEFFAYFRGTSTPTATLRKVSTAGALLNQFSDSRGFNPVIAWNRIYFLAEDTANATVQVRRGGFASSTSRQIGTLRFHPSAGDNRRISNWAFGSNRLFLLHGTLGSNLRLWEVVNDVLIPRVDLPEGFSLPEASDFTAPNIAVANDTVFIPGYFRRRRPGAALEGVVIAVERGRVRTLGPFPGIQFWAVLGGMNEVWLAGTGDLTATGAQRDRNGIYRLDLTTGGIAKYSGSYPSNLQKPYVHNMAKGSRPDEEDGAIYMATMTSQNGTSSTARVYRTTNTHSVTVSGSAVKADLFCAESTVIEPIYDFRTPNVQKLLTEVEIQVESMPTVDGKVRVEIALDGKDADGERITTDAFGQALELTSADAGKVKRFVMSSFGAERSFKFMQPRTILKAGRAQAGDTDNTQTPVLLAVTFKSIPVGSERFYRFVVDLSPDSPDDTRSPGAQLSGNQLLQSLRKLRDDPKDRVYRIRPAYADDESPYPPGDEEEFDVVLAGWDYRSTEEGKGICELTFRRLEVPA